MKAGPGSLGRPLFWQVLHGLIVTLFVYQCLYAAYQVFVTFQPDGTFGPLNSTAATVSNDIVMMRRLYALEGWIAFAGLAVYSRAFSSACSSA